MIVLLASIIIPFTIYYLLPPTIKQWTGKPVVSRIPLIIAGLLYFFSWYLPSPLIRGDNTDFTTHLIGGGVFSGFVWLYIKNHLQWKPSLILELLTLFIIVSSLGVANELAEFLLVELKLLDLSSYDTWWDLLANSIGAFLFWIAYKVSRKVV